MLSFEFLDRVAFVGEQRSAVDGLQTDAKTRQKNARQLGALLQVTDSAKPGWTVCRVASRDDLSRLIDERSNPKVPGAARESIEELEKAQARLSQESRLVRDGKRTPLDYDPISKFSTEDSPVRRFSGSSVARPASQPA